jgi:RNA polymerase sigma-32 factor
MVARSSEWARYQQLARRRPILDVGRERDLLTRAQASDPAATSELVQCHMRLVVQVAFRYARQGLSAHDLIGEGVLGLMEAVRRFDLSRDTRFGSYATWWVRACIRQYALANRRIVGVPSTRGARLARARLRKAERMLSQHLGRKPTARELSEAMEVSERDVELVEVALSSRDLSLTPVEDGPSFEPEDRAPLPEQVVADAELRARHAASLEAALRCLSARERAVVCEHLYREDTRSLTDLGRLLGVSRQRAGQIFAHACDKLRVQLEPGTKSTSPEHWTAAAEVAPLRSARA